VGDWSCLRDCLHVFWATVLTGTACAFQLSISDKLCTSGSVALQVGRGGGALVVGGQPSIAESMYGQGMYGAGPMYGPMYGYPKAEGPYPPGLREREPAPVKFTEASVLQVFIISWTLVVFVTFARDPACWAQTLIWPSSACRASCS
jgi:hypothetical protein